MGLSVRHSKVLGNALSVIKKSPSFLSNRTLHDLIRLCVAIVIANPEQIDSTKIILNKKLSNESFLFSVRKIYNDLS